jgi:hypothetical protein
MVSGEPVVADSVGYIYSLLVNGTPTLSVTTNGGRDNGVNGALVPVLSGTDTGSVTVSVGDLISVRAQLRQLNVAKPDDPDDWSFTWCTDVMGECSACGSCDGNICIHNTNHAPSIATPEKWCFEIGANGNLNVVCYTGGVPQVVQTFVCPM